MQGRLLRLFLVAALFGGLPTTASAQSVTQFAKTVSSQKENFQDRIDALQRQVDDLFADKSFCSAEERKEAYDKIRDLQRQITALRNEYNSFKAGAIKTAATPGYGPQLDAAGIHPDDRKYWADTDNALARLRDSALEKANRIEQAPYRDCSEPKSTSASQPPPAPPKPPKALPEPPATTTPPPSTPPGGQKPTSECTDKEATERRLRIQEEILKLEEELIPIDGTTPEGRARQLQLRAEIDRLAGYLSLPCPPRLPPLKATIPAPKPAQTQPTPKAVGGTKKTDGSIGQSDTGRDYIGDFKRALAEYRAAKKNCDVDAMAAARTEMTSILAAFKPVWEKYEKTSSIYGSDSDLLKWMENQRREAESEGFLSAECPHPSLRPTDPFEQLEDDADDALDDLDDAMDDCDEDAVKEMIPHLEELARQAHAAAEAARAAGGLSRIDPKEAEAMAKDLDEAIVDAKKYRCYLKPLKRYIRVGSIYQRILEIHNLERAALGVPALEWDHKLEWHAVGYADMLSVTQVLGHSSRQGRGIERENLGTGLIGSSPDQIVIRQWVAEKAHFHSGDFPNVCDGEWSVCAHYTQMIWITTRKVGCGYEVSVTVWLVCRYSPGGNKDGKYVGDFNAWVRPRLIGGDYGRVPPPPPPPPPPLPLPLRNAVRISPV